MIPSVAARAFVYASVDVESSGFPSGILALLVKLLHQPALVLFVWKSRSNCCLCFMEPKYRGPLEVLVFGAGAVGSIFGWRLAQNPAVRVSVICRSNYERVKKENIQIITQLWERGSFRPHRVARSVLELQDVPFDYVICANKNVRSNESAFVDTIRPAIRPTTTLVSVQNGIDVEQPLTKAHPRNLVLSAICYISCRQRGPCLVEQIAQIRPHAFHIGPSSHMMDDGKSEASRVDVLVRMDSSFRAVKDINTERWTKMVFNGSWNPVAALSGYDTHQIQQQPHLLAMVQRLAEEIYEVALKSGAKLPRTLLQETLRSAATAPPMVPSMLQDARSGREMEIEPLCGNVLRKASALGVPVPTVRATYELLLKAERDGLSGPKLEAQLLLASTVLRQHA